MFKKSLITTCCFLSFSAVAGGSFNYDGHYNQAEYDEFGKTFAIDYTYKDADNVEHTITGGKLAIANNGGNTYLYIAHPLGFKDLSYGGIKEGGNNDPCHGLKKAEKKACQESPPPTPSTSGDDFKVGWGDQKEHYDLDEAIKSEFFTLTFQDGNEVNSSSYQVTFNPGMPGSIPNNISGGGAINVEFLSTMNYNAKLLTGNDNGDITDINGINYEENSPVRMACSTDESSSDEACYLPIAGEDVPLWDFNFGIEIMLSGVSEFFGDDLANLSTGIFGYQNGISGNTDDQNVLVSLDNLHASDPKENCLKPDEDDHFEHELCGSAKVVEIESVPEPSSLAIFGLGLLGLYTRRKNAIKKHE